MGGWGAKHQKLCSKGFEEIETPLENIVIPTDFLCFLSFTLLLQTSHLLRFDNSVSLSLSLLTL
jgi:hypothetical protein